MLSPIQSTPLPLEPARQQLTPPPQASLPPPPPPPAEQPLPPAATPKDKFAGKDGQQDNDEETTRRQQQQQLEVNRELNSAWARLTTLQQMARKALGEGDGQSAKLAAIEAAAVAASIRDMANSLPGVSVGAIDIPAALDSARSGLGTAMQVVDLAHAIPHHPVEDRIAITGARHQVVEAMAGVEAVAAELVPAPIRLSVESSARLDVKA